jgi:hypothetical protein
MSTLVYTRVTRLLAAVGAALLLLLCFSAAPPAHAAKAPKPPAATCGNGQTLGSFKVGRTGVDQTTVDPSYTVQMSGASLIVAPVEPYSLTGVIEKNSFVASSPAEVFAPDTATFDNPYTKGKAQTVTVCGVFYANGYPTPPPPTTDFTLDFSCYAATYVDRNWEFAWNYMGGTVAHTFDINYSDVETGLTETLTTPVEAGSTGGGTFEQANIGDHVTITVSVDGVDQPSFAFSGVVDSTTACSASMTAP